MTQSDSLKQLENAVTEIEDLLRANPSRTRGISRDLAVTSAIGRASVVLLTSHFERYFYSINEQAVDFFNRLSGDPSVLPEELRLWHSKVTLDDISGTNWNNRSNKLVDFVATDAWLWANPATAGTLSADRLMSWMRSPKPREIVRFYRLWGIDDIFSVVTRKMSTRGAFYLKIQSLADKRNSIAHGEAQEKVTITDVKSYASKSREFVRRADRAFSRHLSRLLKAPPPW